MPVLFGAAVEGVQEKLPTRGELDTERTTLALLTASGLVQARIGVTVSPSLADMARDVVEYGAAALIELGDFPEQDGAQSPGQAKYNRFLSMRTDLEMAVEREGGEPEPGERPAYSFTPPLMIQFRGF